MEDYPILAYDLAEERDKHIQKIEERHHQEEEARKLLGQRHLWWLHDLRAILQRFYTFFDPLEDEDQDGMTQQRTYA